MTLVDLVSAWVASWLAYGSGVGTGITIGIVFGLLFSFPFWEWYYRREHSRNPYLLIKRSLHEYRQMNRDLFDAEHLFQFPELADEPERDTP